ncbi:MAG: DNA ligase [Cellvibrionaceae bacterium]
MTYLNSLCLVVVLNCCLLADGWCGEKPALLLAKSYQQNIVLDEYWVSEKYDGFRAYWDGDNLLSRQGHRFSAPAWFTQKFPPHPLDGELWIARQSFEQLASVVRQKKPHSGWRDVRYLVFDSPSLSTTFTQRLEVIKRAVSDANSPYLKMVPQFKLDSHDALLLELERRVKAGAEGLMLHRGDSYYHQGRSSDLLKLKPLEDAEARVIQHLEGKGKYQSMMGALLVELPSGLRFRVGTGFSDEERKRPPAIGDIVTFQYTGLTQRGVPRFARFLRIRNDVNWAQLKIKAESL